MDERQRGRTVTDRQIVCHFDGRAELLLMYDLSVDGCMIEAPSVLKKDDLISVELLDGVETPANVVWSKSGHAGLLFHERIHPVIVQHLGFRQPAANFVDKRPTDRFGRALPDLPLRGDGPPLRKSSRQSRA